jgi:Golgi nucleoside diphosphatase
MNKKIITFCGYRCDLCPAFKDNINKIPDKTIIRQGWKNFFGFDVPEDRIVCVGCNQEGTHLDTECPVRPCAMEKHVKNCYFCTSFETCEKLQSRADIVDETRKKSKRTISEKDYALFFRLYEGRKELKQQRK